MASGEYNITPLHTVRVSTDLEVSPTLAGGRLLRIHIVDSLLHCNQLGKVYSVYNNISIYLRISTQTDLLSLQRPALTSQPAEEQNIIDITELRCQTRAREGVRVRAIKDYTGTVCKADDDLRSTHVCTADEYAMHV